MTARLEYVDEQGAPVVASSAGVGISFVRAFAATTRIFPLMTPKIPAKQQQASRAQSPPPLCSVVCGQPYILHCNVENTSPHNLMIESMTPDFSKSSSRLSFTSNMSGCLPADDDSKGGGDEAPGGGEELRSREKITTSFAMRVKDEEDCAGGVLQIKWRRQSAREQKSISSMSRISLPSFRVVEPTFRVTIDAPKRCHLLDTVRMVLTVQSSSPVPQRIELSVTPPANAEALTVAGPTNFSFYTPPKGVHVLKYTITACQSGAIPLPLVQLYSTRYSKFIYDANDLGVIFVNATPIDKTADKAT
eukprot:CAMPEP_0185265360 /NCGR_PEP_ID=MMETSP1359-20130426/27253_1 /TAXON_ID=552665 /ORGANISM="Bigelowiella longifila, Strain CCMP242" /LENGTH=304 /DNA_ID=CAMNT_0027854575 /DNA_START=20 /DNA_END=934 /DNA_ORIENTATION=+